MSAPRRPLPWSPAAVENALHEVLHAYQERARQWREDFEDLDEDLLAEAAGEARIFGADPVAAVDKLVRALLSGLGLWQEAIGTLRWDLAAAAQERPLPSGRPTPAVPRTSTGARPAPHSSTRSPATITACCPTPTGKTDRGDRPVTRLKLV
ncbi:hypothetical protein [Kitasatospora sp. SolWspMP-SS2h]|uniref:hypothetical protein n=1 Tax=Kitasatospora sp. SolWspMP-SS2h TaxID=1305729 RepID=UPI0011B93651|nr:hypothetical protein [Kitasatospora sp. SolWspMP-SS2h]